MLSLNNFLTFVFACSLIILHVRADFLLILEHLQKDKTIEAKSDVKYDSKYNQSDIAPIPSESKL